MAIESDRKLLRLPQVQELFPVSVTTIYKKIRDGEFPRPIKIGRNSFWRQTEVEAYISSVQLRGVHLGIHFSNSK